LKNNVSCGDAAAPPAKRSRWETSAPPPAPPGLGAALAPSGLTSVPPMPPVLLGGTGPGGASSGAGLSLAGCGPGSGQPTLADIWAMNAPTPGHAALEPRQDAVRGDPSQVKDTCLALSPAPPRPHSPPGGEGVHQDVDSDRRTRLPVRDDGGATGKRADDISRRDESAGRENEFRKWKNAIVEFARPFLNRPYANKEITKEEYKSILKKVTDKVVLSYREKHSRPPSKCAITDGQAASIKKLLDEYIEFTKRHWS